MKGKYILIIVSLILILIIFDIIAIFAYKAIKNDSASDNLSPRQKQSVSIEDCCRECVISLTSKPETSRSKPCFVFVNDATLRYKLSDPCSGYFKDNSKITIKECMDY